MAESTGNSNVLGGVAYILTWLTGLIILLVADKQDKNARWHAIQAIALGIVFFVVQAVVNMAFGGVSLASGGPAALGSVLGAGGVVSLVALILIIICAVKAFQGGRFRLPGLAGFADKYA